jgi:chromosome segregation ATPase
VRRLREEIKFLSEQQTATEQELRTEMEQANGEETRLRTELSDLRRKLVGSSTEKELASAKETIQRLEFRILELETLLPPDEQQDSSSELSMLRRDLLQARQKETDYVKREGAQKEVLRSLKKQVTELERKAHELEVSRIQTASPRSSVNGSAHKSEIIEVRHQLAQAHQTLKDLRSQLRQVEREAASKVSVATRELESKSLVWDSERDTMEQELEKALAAKSDLSAKKMAAEKSATRLRSKIERLEMELQNERGKHGEDHTISLERRDLHAMLRDTQIQAESLEISVQKRDDAIASLSASETELRTQLARIRNERSIQRDRALSAVQQLDNLEKKYRRQKNEWEEEKRGLMRGVRFANMSVSERGNESELIRVNEAAEIRHKKELRGLAMQIEWLRARCRREEGLRADAAYAKRFMLLQVGLFDAW